MENKAKSQCCVALSPFREVQFYYLPRKVGHNLDENPPFRFLWSALTKLWRSFSFDNCRNCWLSRCAAVGFPGTKEITYCILDRAKDLDLPQYSSFQLCYWIEVLYLSGPYLTVLPSRTRSRLGCILESAKLDKYVNLEGRKDCSHWF